MLALRSSARSEEVDEVLKKLVELEKKVDAIYKSAEKTRKYFMWTLILSVSFFVLPLIGLVFVIPQFINSIGGGNGTGYMKGYMDLLNR